MRSLNQARCSRIRLGFFVCIQPRLKSTFSESKEKPIFAQYMDAREKTRNFGGAKTVAQGSTNKNFVKLVDELQKSFSRRKSWRSEWKDRSVKELARERNTSLVFRPVGGNLDRFNAIRDTFLWLKYLRFGQTYAVDSELERTLRYYNEHATVECRACEGCNASKTFTEYGLVNTQFGDSGGKLMRGPDTLFPISKPEVILKRKEQVSTLDVFNVLEPSETHTGAILSRSKTVVNEAAKVLCPELLFPPVHLFSMSQFVGVQAPQQINGATPANSSEGFFENTYATKFYSEPNREGLLDPNSVIRKPRISRIAPMLAKTSTKDIQFHGSESVQVTFRGSFFHRPAVIIISQLGQRVGTNGANAWTALTLKHLDPKGYNIWRESIGNPVSAESANHNKVSRTQRRQIDVYNFRSLDTYEYEFMHKIMVGRYAQSLLSQHASSGGKKDIPLYSTLESVAGNTFVGEHIIHPFFISPFCLRNYLTCVVLLVDHRGRVRWMSAGGPDVVECVTLPKLLTELEQEFINNEL